MNGSMEHGMLGDLGRDGNSSDNDNYSDTMDHLSDHSLDTPLSLGGASAMFRPGVNLPPSSTAATTS